jgi:hypothetical protein
MERSSGGAECRSPEAPDATSSSGADPREARPAACAPKQAKSDGGPTDRWVAAGLLVVVFLITRGHALFSSVTPDYQHLGAEYYNIARAIVDGRGFSDPFGEVTGATAWMPPLYSLLLAGLLLVLKQKSLVAVAAVVIADIAYAAVGFTIFRIAKGSCCRLSPLVSVALYVGWLWAFYPWFFLGTHDIWLVMLVFAGIVFLLFRYRQTSQLAKWKWGLLGGLTTITSPALALAWALPTLWWIVKSREHRRSLLLSCTLALAMAAPWTMRNAMAFHRFIPLKSNLWYDAYQANYMDDDGVYDSLSFVHHPFNSLATRFRYAKLGEIGFADECRSRFYRAVRDNPRSLVNKVVSRALAGTVRYVPFEPEPPVGLIVRRVVFGLPLLGFLIALWGPNRRSLLGLGQLYFAYLFPYILVASYLRYLLPMTPIAIVFLFGALDALALRWGGSSTTAPVRGNRVRREKWSILRRTAADANGGGAGRDAGR